MQKIINFFAGSVYVKICSSYPERFFNLCARSGIEFWDMSSEDAGVFYVRMTVANFKKLPEIIRKTKCRIHIIEKNGFPFFVYRFRKRRALIAGFVLFCVAAWIFTGFVWVIDIDGFAGLDIAKLKEELAASGLKIGTYSAGVELDELKNNILIKMPELSYVSVNFSGSHAYVTVKKRILPPKMLSEKTPCDIIADKDGIISSITVKKGTGEVACGETVIKGQILASGYITGRAGTTILTHADAEIYARTWKKLSARIPKNYNRKVYTGEEKTIYTIILPKIRIKLSLNSGISYAKCDKIIEKTELEFFGGLKLPLSLERATYREYTLRPDKLSDEEAYSELGKALNEAVETSEKAELINSDFKTSSDEMLAYATLIAEFNEPIGVKREMLRNG